MSAEAQKKSLASALRPHLNKIHTDMAIIVSLWKEGRLEDPLFLEALEEIAYEVDLTRTTLNGVRAIPTTYAIGMDVLDNGGSEMGYVWGPYPTLIEALRVRPTEDERHGHDAYIVRFDGTESRPSTTRLFKLRVEGEEINWVRLAE